MTAFADLSPRAQLYRLRQMALAALEHYDLEVRRVRLLRNAFNANFRVDTADGRIYALRINRPGMHSLAEMRSQAQWMAALARESTVGVPAPVQTRAGDLFALVESPAIPEPRYCSLASWIPGRDLDEALTPENCYKLGLLATHLHEHGARFLPPAGFTTLTYDRVFPYGEAEVLFDPAYGDVFGPSQALLRASVDQVQATLDAMFADRRALQLIHNDLHQWNTKIHRGRLYVLDFEDMAWSYPLHDVAVTFYYLHHEPQYPALRAAYERGYRNRLPWVEQQPGQIERLMMGRTLMLLNFQAQSDLASERAEVPLLLRQVQQFMALLESMGLG